MTEFGVITACDHNYFRGLLLLHQSIQESHSCEVVCYDVGLTAEQRQYAERFPTLQILPLPDDQRIERIKCAMENERPLKKPGKRIWPLWICPILIQNAPFRDVIWMDCDIVVLRNFSELLEEIERGPFFTPENKAPEVTPNKPELYQLMPIQRTFDPLVPTINAGVSCWRLDRDAAVLDAYVLPVERAIDDVVVREAISWHDQGALIWAIQMLGLEHRVARTNCWNLCVGRTEISGRRIEWNQKTLPLLRHLVPDANILHWNGMKPPWQTK